MDRVLFSPLHYPGDYGMIPQTLSEDGYPLDALVLVTSLTHHGILIEAKSIGLLRIKDQGKLMTKFSVLRKTIQDLLTVTIQVILKSMF